MTMSRVFDGENEIADLKPAFWEEKDAISVFTNWTLLHYLDGVTKLRAGDVLKSLSRKFLYDCITLLFIDIKDCYICSTTISECPPNSLAKRTLLSQWHSRILHRARLRLL